jgi:hypothetical protein
LDDVTIMVRMLYGLAQIIQSQKSIPMVEYMRFAHSLDDGNTFQPAINPAPNDPKGEQSYPFMTISKFHI